MAQRGGHVDSVVLAGLLCLSMGFSGASLTLRAPKAPVVAAVAVAHAAKKIVVLEPLPIKPLPGQSHRDIARALAKRDPFMALALGVEDSPAKAYVDRAGANVGAGYCIEARRRALGEPKVRGELERAGFDDEEIASLLSRDKGRIEAVNVGHEKSLRLLSMTKPQYEAMAREAVGAKLFARLPAHKRDVLSYLAYNTGGPSKFVKLIAAVQSGNDVAALSELAPSVRGPEGKKLRNHRLRAWAQAAWISAEELKNALDKPIAFESAYAGKMGQKRFIQNHWAFLMEKMRAPAARLAHASAPAPRIKAKLDAKKIAQAKPESKHRSGRA